MPSKTGTRHGAKVQPLQRIGLEVRCNKSEQARCKVVVVANAALHRIRGGSRYRAGCIIRRVDRICVYAELVAQSRPRRRKGQREVLGLAVTASQIEPDCRTPSPAFE